MANWYNVDTLTSSPSQVNFLVFVPLFSLISIAYLEAVPKFMPKCKRLFQRRQEFCQMAIRLRTCKTNMHLVQSTTRGPSCPLR